MQDFFCYFAGYIDGDGHFRFKKYIQNGYEKYSCKIMITSTEEAPLIYFKNNVGGAYYAKKKSNQNWKQEFIYTLHVGIEKFEKIKELANFLIEKKSQFLLIKQFLFGNKIQRINVIEQAKIERESYKAQRDIFHSIKKNTTRIPATKNDFIYLCGYIDSECCLTVTRKVLKTGSKSFSCHLRVGTTKYPCIQFLFSKFGGCISYKKPKNKSSTDVIDLQITNKSLEPILKNITPYLITKKRQCEQMISLRDTYKLKKFPRDKDFITYYAQVTPTRDEIFLNLKALNKRGI